MRETDKPSFDPSLWFLVRDGEEVCGVALCKVPGDEGWVDVVGVRRRGAPAALDSPSCATPSPSTTDAESGRWTLAWTPKASPAHPDSTVEPG